MSGWKRHYRAATDATEPSGGAVDRLRARGAWAAHLLHRAAIEPRRGAVDRLRTRRPRVRSQRWILLIPALALLLWLLRPPSPLSERLTSEHLTERELTSAVRLGYQGAGTVSGTVRDPRIRWEAGTLDVAVAPGRGVALAVETDEAVVHVVGTAFTVTRDALGTAVAVTHGRVRVSCTGASTRELAAGERVECLPVRPAAWIGRAQALIARGRPTDEVLAAVDRGLGLAAPGDPAAGELVALRIRVLMEARRYADALAAAEAYLESGATPRRPEVEELARALRGHP